MFEVIRETLPLGVLARRIADNQAPAEWGLAIPHGKESWKERARMVAAGSSDSWLDPLNDAFNLQATARDRLTAVAQNRGVVVTTGQQPGLFGGPLYTWYKAFTALALANAIERTCGVAAAPVFWAATDDSDLEEANWTALATRGGARLLRMKSATREGTPMALAKLGDPGEALAQLSDAASPVAFPEYLEIVQRSYSGAATVGSAYVALLRAVLQPLGIAVLDAAHESVRDRARAVLTAALGEAAAVSAAVTRRNDEIRSHGIEPQVHDVSSLSLVFRHVDGVRARIPVSDALAVSRGNHASLSPNVLLRPIVERSILPTVAYVGGPAELAYFAQTAAVSRELRLETPIAVPRYSGVIVEEHIRRILEKYSIDAIDLASPHEAWSRLARNGIPAEALTALDELKKAADLAFDRIRTSTTTGSDPIFGQPAIVDGAKASTRHRINRFERRLIAAAKRRDVRLADDIATARGALYPLGRRQERALNFIPLLARHGEDLIASLMDAAHEHAEQLILGGVDSVATAATRAGTASASD